MKTLFTSTFVITALLASAALAQPAAAQDETPMTTEASEQSTLEMRADDVVALLNGEADPQDLFTNGFLAQVPPAQMVAIAQQLTGQFGPAIAVEELPSPAANRSALAIRMERAVARGGIAIDPASGRISELLFQSFEPIGDTPEDIERDIAALPGEVSYYFGPLIGSQDVISGSVDQQMALGSTFKLYVLATLAREVAQGERSWGDVVQLDVRSFPSGSLQDWPEGAPVTLHTLASMMISISDNTATDQLIAVLGRDAVLQTMIDSGHSQPSLNDPFLTTRELFLLKGGPDGRLSTYATADADVRLQILAGIEDIVVPPAEIQAAFSDGPRAIDIEWFASARDLANLFAFMRETADSAAFEIMAINPSMPPPLRSRWAYAGYKGGSEPGVLNLTWLLTDDTGADHVLVLSWNNSEASLDEDALELIAQRILSLPR